MSAPLSRTDWTALALGLLGIVLFAVGLPLIHPDARADFSLGAAEAETAARTFLTESGFVLDDLDPFVQRAVRATMLNAAQDSLGRRAALAELGGEAGAVRPGYDWRVAWRTPRPLTAEPEAPALTVRLNQRGEVWQFTRAADRLPGERRDRSGRLRSPEGNGFSNAEAAAIAREHLGRTAYARLALEVDSVEAVVGSETRARVFFSSPEPVLGESLRLSMLVTAQGRLMELRGDLAHAEAPVVTGFTITRGDGLRGAVRWTAYILLVLALLIVVVRRLTGRVLDTRSALADAALAAGAAGFSILVGIPGLQGELGTASGALVFVIAIATLFFAASIGLLVFVTSSGADALERDSGRRSLHSTALVRMGVWRSEPVGRALVRGAALAGVLAGLATAFFLLLPDARLGISPNQYGIVSDSLYLPVAGAFATSLWSAIVVVQAGLVVVAAFVTRWRAALLIPVAALTLGVLQIHGLPMPGTGLSAFAGALVLGVVVAWSYARTDALTVVVGLVLAGTLWGSTQGYLMAGVGAIDFVMALGLVAATASFGAYGVLRGQPADVLPVYEPDFLIEQRERGRMQRELEIAREVQLSFLPSRLPEVPGLEVAARCVPAQEVGGDYYDLIPLGETPSRTDRLAIVIGDVSGKGIQAAFFMTLMKGFLQSLVRDEADPEVVLARLNTLFRANAPRGTFVTMSYAVIDLDARTLRFARAGHTPLVLRRADGSVKALRPAGMALGMAEPSVFEDALRAETVALAPGDTLVFYTDGISEARAADGTLYTDGRLAEVAAAETGSAEATLAALQQSVGAHAAAAEAADDSTAVVVRIL